VLVTGREPMIGRIRLAWWREALERLDRESPPKEPVLEGVATHLLPAGIGGAELAAMEDGWLAILGDEPVEAEALATYAARRGGLLFDFSARLLGGQVSQLAAAGEAWALVDLARHSTEPHDVEAALAAARARTLPRRWPRALRPLGMLAVLADRDLRRGPAAWEEPGAPPRTARMLRHRLTGW
jgi:phytoene synthase